MNTEENKEQNASAGEEQGNASDTSNVTEGASADSEVKEDSAEDEESEAAAE